MDKKTAKATLDELAPGWAKAESPSVYIKTAVDPKHRMACHAALAVHGAPKPDRLDKTKAKAKAKAPTKTTTKKEG